jgi:hypothetical protein
VYFVKYCGDSGMIGTFYYLMLLLPRLFRRKFPCVSSL